MVLGSILQASETDHAVVGWEVGGLRRRGRGGVYVEGGRWGEENNGGWLAGEKRPGLSLKEIRKLDAKQLGWSPSLLTSPSHQSSHHSLSPCVAFAIVCFVCRDRIFFKKK